MLLIAFFLIAGQLQSFSLRNTPRSWFLGLGSLKNRSRTKERFINHLKAQLNPICHLLALLGAHHIFHVSFLRVKMDTE